METSRNGKPFRTVSRGHLLLRIGMRLANMSWSPTADNDLRWWRNKGIVKLNFIISIIYFGQALNGESTKTLELSGWPSYRRVFFFDRIRRHDSG